jgi:shikimate kinase
VAFIGFMGSGKTTAARAAAEALHAVPVDADEVIEERLGKPIERVFAEDGEGAFREAEEAVTVELLEDPANRVVALGGGAIASERVRAALADRLVIWLDVDLETAWARASGSGRPLRRCTQNASRCIRCSRMRSSRPPARPRWLRSSTP